MPLPLPLACFRLPFDLDLIWRGFVRVVWQVADFLHHWQTPCLSFSVQTLPHRLQCPCGAGDVIAIVIRLTPFELICPGEASVQVGHSTIQLLRCVFVFPVSSSHKKRLCDTCKHSDIDFFLGAEGLIWKNRKYFGDTIDRRGWAGVRYDCSILPQETGQKGAAVGQGQPQQLRLCSQKRGGFWGGCTVSPQAGLM